MVRIGLLALQIVSTLAFGKSASRSPDIERYVLPKHAPEPKNNPTTPAKVELGKMLFFDKRLSKDGSVACVSCHDILTNGADTRKFSIGVSGKKLKRQTPTVLNVGLHRAYFWDGRSPSLEEQVHGPLFGPDEMGLSGPGELEKRLGEINGYLPYFKKAFGKKIKAPKMDHVTKALAAFQRTLLTPNAPFDRYWLGDKKALSKDELRGFDLFVTLQCVECHRPPYFGGVHEDGTAVRQYFALVLHPRFFELGFQEDRGLWETTKRQSDDRKWRVPIIRNIARTPPYFHNGAVEKLEEAVWIMAKFQLNTELDPERIAKIVAFLKTLNGELPKIKVPTLPK